MLKLEEAQRRVAASDKIQAMGMNEGPVPLRRCKNVTSHAQEECLCIATATCLRLSPYPIVATGSVDGIVRVFDRSGEKIADVPPEAPGSIVALDISDEALALYGGSDGHWLYLFLRTKLHREWLRIPG